MASHHRRNQPTAPSAAAAAASPHPTDPTIPSSYPDNLSKSHPPSRKVGKKPNDSEEKFEGMINCITAKEREQEHQHLLSRSLSVSLSSSRTRRSIHVGGVKVVSTDMPPFMQIHAVDCATKAHDTMENFTSKSLALTLKKEFDGAYGPAWHCIVGKSFGSFVTHSVGGFLYFSMPQKLYILLFKTTVQRAN